MAKTAEVASIAQFAGLKAFYECPAKVMPPEFSALTNR
jgi:hypothetical protein